MQIINHGGVGWLAGLFVLVVLVMRVKRKKDVINIICNAKG